MRRVLFAAALGACSCVGPLPSAEVVDRLQILGIRAWPSSVSDSSGTFPTQLIALAADGDGIARGASFEYAACRPGAPTTDPPDCFPPNGVDLPSTGEFGDLDFSVLLRGAPQPLPASFDVTVRATLGGEEAVALKRIPLLPKFDYVSSGEMTVDDVVLDGTRAVQVTQGSHQFAIRPNCNDGYCDISWYVTGGAPADDTGLLVDANHWGPNASFGWVAPPGPARVTVVAVVRSVAHAGGADWAWGVVDVAQ